MKERYFGTNSSASRNIARIRHLYNHAQYYSRLQVSALDFVHQKISNSVGHRPVYPAQGMVNIQGEVYHS